MAATVGELVVNLVARTSRFNRGMDQAGRKATAFGGKVKSAGSMIAGFAATLGVAAAGWKAVSWFREGAAEIDRMAKVSRKLGLTVEQLNALHHAADLAGVSSNTLDMALQRMTRRVAEAAMGTGEAKAALRELGVDAKKLAAAGPYQALRRIADALQQVEDPANRVRLAFKLFDSEGVDLVNMLDRGSKGLDEIKRKMDRISGVTTAGARNVEAMNDWFAKWDLFFTQGGRNRTVEAWANLGAQIGLWEGNPPNPVNQRELAELKRQNRARMEMEAKLQELRKKFSQATIEVSPRKLSDQQKRINAFVEEARAVGMGNLEIAKRVNLYSAAAEASEKLAEAQRKAAERRSMIRGLIGAELRGGREALQLPGAVGRDSPEIYRMLATRGLQPTGDRTDREILRNVREQLAEQKRTTEQIERLAAKLEQGVVEFK